MVELGFVWVCFGIRLRNTFSDHPRVALLVTCVVAVSTLHTSRVFEEVAAESAAHDVVELLLHELVTILLDHVFLTLTNSSLSTKADIEWCLILRMFGEGHRKVDAPNWFQ